MEKIACPLEIVTTKDEMILKIYNQGVNKPSVDVFLDLQSAIEIRKLFNIFIKTQKK